MRIAVFDSGMGGITVLKELRKSFPQFNFLYYGDTANVPYGTKSHTQIKTLVKAASIEIKNKKVDAMVIACNTASCIALDECCEVMGETPVYSVVEAGIATITRILKKDPSKPVLVLGTKATVRSKTYSTSLKNIFDVNIPVYEQECPLLVPMIEEGWINHPIMQQTVEEYTKAYLSLSPGIAFLACTHYPWIKSAFEKALPGWQVIDSAALVVETLAENSKTFLLENKTAGNIEWLLTDQEVFSPLIELSKEI